MPADDQFTDWDWCKRRRTEPPPLQQLIGACCWPKKRPDHKGAQSGVLIQTSHGCIGSYAWGARAPEHSHQASPYPVTGTSEPRELG